MGLLEIAGGRQLHEAERGGASDQAKRTASRASMNLS
jgi:hypothetical protein